MIVCLSVYPSVCFLRVSVRAPVRVCRFYGNVGSVWIAEVGYDGVFACLSVCLFFYLSMCVCRFHRNTGSLWGAEVGYDEVFVCPSASVCVASTVMHDQYGEQMLAQVVHGPI